MPIMRTGLVAFVCVLLISVPLLGFTYVLPTVCSGWILALNFLWATFLAINVYFNFAAAASRLPG
jgi:hypothetical protein